MGNRWLRLWHHLLTDHADVRRAFPAAVMERIEAAVAEGERTHAAEIRLAVEASLPPVRVLAGLPTRDRALEVFGVLRVWDTEDNNGVLVYLLMADHAVEIVADRAATQAIGPETWQAIAAELSAAYREGRFEAGTLAAIGRLNRLLAQAFPAGARNPDELPNRPVVL